MNGWTQAIIQGMGFLLLLFVVAEIVVRTAFYSWGAIRESYERHVRKN